MRRSRIPVAVVGQVALAVALALPAAVASAQSAPGDVTASAAASPAAPAPAPARRGAPRPVMGLMVPLTKPDSAATTNVTGRPFIYQNTKPTAKAEKYYAQVWGVDRLRANYTSSGNLIRFTYRVLNPKLAAPLGDHVNTPEMVGIRSNAVLHIPTMEKIGQLRQMSPGEANREYWMVFSNKGNLVKPGDEVSVIIGKFRADGLIVQ